MMETMLEHPEQTLFEIVQQIAAVFGNQYQLSNVCRYFQRHDVTRTTLSRIAQQQSEVARINFCADTSLLDADMLVFLDESGFLMRQIDLMVSAKKAEWENHLHAVQIQLEKRNKELGFMKTHLEQKTQEVERLQHNVKDMEIAQRGAIDEYEQHVMHLKEEVYTAYTVHRTCYFITEVDNLKYEHEKLQKKSGKQAFHVEKERDQVVADLKLKESEVQRLNDRIEGYKVKAVDFEGARHAWEDRIDALENQKKALLENSDLNQ
ncbi:hypothetical protein QZH41_018839 [Actinostola sp. cb2023]|nr:hypothetical protein QZH41_018839 [Actinostola sp. cb2023]